MRQRQRRESPWGALRLEHGYADGKVTNTQTGDETSHHHMNPRFHSCYLNNVANDENGDTHGHAVATTELVGSESAAQSTDEATDAHETDEETLDDGHPLARAVVLLLGEAVLEIREEKHRRNLTGVITEEEASNGRDNTQEEGLGTAVGAIDLDAPVVMTS